MSTKAESGNESEGEPNFYAPYPDEIERVKEAETEGAAEVIQLIEDEWPCEISHLEQESMERGLGRDGEGFSGSFIRSVLRTHFDRARDTSREGRGEVTVEDEFELKNEAEEWEKAYRQGVKIGLITSLHEKGAVSAFTDGFVEGRKLKAEMDLEALNF